MKYLLVLIAVLSLTACTNVDETVIQEMIDTAVDQKMEEVMNNPHSDMKDGVLLHVKSGIDNPHEVLMAMQMATMMSEEKNVILYFDINGVDVLKKDAPDLEYAHFNSSHTALSILKEKGIKVMACPGCMKAHNINKEDLREGVMVADKSEFFNFTDGRILILDY